jgi:trk system potassium uptake protein TrkA
MNELRRVERPYRRVMIAGGGLIGERLAKEVEAQFSVKVIEYDGTRCAELAAGLSDAVVLHGDATDQELLIEENIEHTDVFCALTNDDEVNIMSSLLAKRLGARQVMALITKPSYVDLVQDGQVDIAISPQLATVSTLLTHVRRADVAQVHRLRRGAAEAMEAIAHGSPDESKVVGRSIADIELPAGTSIGALVRGEEVLIAHDDTIIETDDHVILFLVDKAKAAAVERLFQVGLSFF